MTARDQADFNGLVTQAVTTPAAVTLSDQKWLDRGGQNWSIRLQRRQQAQGEAHGWQWPRRGLNREEESKQTLALLKVATQNAVGTATPFKARAQLIKAALAPLSGLQLTDALKQLPEIIESIMHVEI